MHAGESSVRSTRWLFLSSGRSADDVELLLLRLVSCQITPVERSIAVELIKLVGM